jgi:hypothetical protein
VVGRPVDIIHRPLYPEHGEHELRDVVQVTFCFERVQLLRAPLKARSVSAPRHKGGTVQKASRRPRAIRR